MARSPRKIRNATKPRAIRASQFTLHSQTPIQFTLSFPKWKCSPRATYAKLQTPGIPRMIKWILNNYAVIIFWAIRKARKLFLSYHIIVYPRKGRKKERPIFSPLNIKPLICSATSFGFGFSFLCEILRCSNGGTSGGRCCVPQGDRESSSRPSRFNLQQELCSYHASLGVSSCFLCFPFSLSTFSQLPNRIWVSEDFLLVCLVMD